MTEQDWVMAGLYLAGSMTIALMVCALSTRANRMRAAIQSSTERR
ncbi:hypothetical protein [Paraburkholderia sp. BCC1886]|nr:hypothetical protein [Paraburkholderia sp. BCC1886]